MHHHQHAYGARVRVAAALLYGNSHQYLSTGNAPAHRDGAVRSVLPAPLAPRRAYGYGTAQARRSSARAARAQTVSARQGHGCIVMAT